MEEAKGKGLITAPVEELWGTTDESYLHYWTQKFPGLVVYVWSAASQ